MINSLLRTIFNLFIVWPVIHLWLGVRVKNPEKLPHNGPAIIVANHNSHLDTFVLLSLFPAMKRPFIRPVAAADYFLKGKLSSWFALNLIGIIPIVRGGKAENPLEACEKALGEGQIIIIYPEGTRGEPDKLAPIKPGIWHLAQHFPDVPVIPVYLKGTGRVMAKGNRIPLPLFVDAVIDDPFLAPQEKTAFQDAMYQRFMALQQHEQGKQS